MDLHNKIHLVSIQYNKPILLVVKQDYPFYSHLNKNNFQSIQYNKLVLLSICIAIKFFWSLSNLIRLPFCQLDYSFLFIRILLSPYSLRRLFFPALGFQKTLMNQKRKLNLLHIIVNISEIHLSLLHMYIIAYPYGWIQMALNICYISIHE